MCNKVRLEVKLQRRMLKNSSRGMSVLLCVLRSRIRLVSHDMSKYLLCSANTQNHA